MFSLAIAMSNQPQQDPRPVTPKDHDEDHHQHHQHLIFHDDAHINAHPTTHGTIPNDLPPLSPLLLDSLIRQCRAVSSPDLRHSFHHCCLFSAALCFLIGVIAAFTAIVTDDWVVESTLASSNSGGTLDATTYSGTSVYYSLLNCSSGSSAPHIVNSVGFELDAGATDVIWLPVVNKGALEWVICVIVFILSCITTVAFLFRLHVVLVSRQLISQTVMAGALCNIIMSSVFYSYFQSSDTLSGLNSPPSSSSSQCYFTGVTFDSLYYVTFFYTFGFCLRGVGDSYRIYQRIRIKLNINKVVRNIVKRQWMEIIEKEYKRQTKRFKRKEDKENQQRLQEAKLEETGNGILRKSTNLAHPDGPLVTNADDDDDNDTAKTLHHATLIPWQVSNQDGRETHEGEDDSDDDDEEGSPSHPPQPTDNDVLTFQFKGKNNDGIDVKPRSNNTTNANNPVAALPSPPILVSSPTYSLAPPPFLSPTRRSSVHRLPSSHTSSPRRLPFNGGYVARRIVWILREYFFMFIDEHSTTVPPPIHPDIKQRDAVEIQELEQYVIMLSKSARILYADSATASSPPHDPHQYCLVFPPYKDIFHRTIEGFDHYRLSRSHFSARVLRILTVVTVAIFYIWIGSVVMYHLQQNTFTFTDSILFAVSSATTLQFGSLAPTFQSSQILLMIYWPLAFCCIGVSMNLIWQFLIRETRGMVMAGIMSTNKKLREWRIKNGKGKEEQGGIGWLLGGIWELFSLDPHDDNARVTNKHLAVSRKESTTGSRRHSEEGIELPVWHHHEEKVDDTGQPPKENHAPDHNNISSHDQSLPNSTPATSASPSTSAPSSVSTPSPIVAAIAESREEDKPAFTTVTPESVKIAIDHPLSVDSNIPLVSSSQSLFPSNPSNIKVEFPLDDGNDPDTDDYNEQDEGIILQLQERNNKKHIEQQQVKAEKERSKTSVIKAKPKKYAIIRKARRRSSAASPSSAASAVTQYESIIGKAHFVIAMLFIGIFLLFPAFYIKSLEPGWSYFDSFYFCFNVLSILGYGKFPATQSGRNFTILYVIMGAFLITYVLASAMTAIQFGVTVQVQQRIQRWGDFHLGGQRKQRKQAEMLLQQTQARKHEKKRKRKQEAKTNRSNTMVTPVTTPQQHPIQEQKQQAGPQQTGV